MTEDKNIEFASEEEFTSYHIDRMQQLGSEYAEYKAKRCYLEDYRKVVRARIAEENFKAGIKSASQQTLAAEADPRYHQILQALRNAIELENKAQWELKSLETRFEHWRTKRADYRAAMNFK